MNVDQCYQLGYVIKPHGLKGEVGILLDVDIPQAYKNLESVFVEINHKLVPFFIHSISLKNDKAIVKFEDVDDFETAESLKGGNLYLPLDRLPPLNGSQFYYHEVIGFSVIDKKSGVLGTIETIYTLPNQDLIALNYQDKEVLIPVKDEIVLSVDRERREIRVAMPEGLLDVYLEE